MRLGPGHVSFEHGAQMLLLCMAERPQSWNVPMKKSNSQRLKKSKTFAFRNSQFAKQHNVSSNGNKSKIFDRVCRSCQSATRVNNLTLEHATLQGLSVGCK